MTSWINRARLTEDFSTLCDRIGLPEFTFHGTRLTHRTALPKRVGKAGAKTVSKRLGHADVMTKISVYQTGFEEDDRKLAEMQRPISGREAKAMKAQNASHAGMLVKGKLEAVTQMSICVPSGSNKNDPHCRRYRHRGRARLGGGIGRGQWVQDVPKFVPYPF
jgi:hypothetical protein